MKRALSPSEPRVLPQEPVQLTLFRSDDRMRTKAVGLWDLTPWAVLYTSEKLRRGDYLKSITRTFEVSGQKYILELKPARIVNADGSEMEEYPNESEQTVELAIRKLAAQQRAISLTKVLVDDEPREMVSITLPLYTIHKELSDNGCSMSYPEIERALAILSDTRFKISRFSVDAEGDMVEDIIQSAIFPTVKVRKKPLNSGDGKSAVQLTVNPLIADAIKSLSFYDVNYSLLMSLRGVERWIYKRLHHAVVFGEYSRPGVYEMRAVDIQASCGIARKQMRDAFRRIVQAFETLKAQDVIADFEACPIVEGRKKVDVSFFVTMSERALLEGKAARKGVQETLCDFTRITGEEPTGWIRPDKLG